MATPREPFPSDTHFRRVDWRPGKRKRQRPRVKPWGGQKQASAAFLESRKASALGQGRHRMCKHCGTQPAMIESDYCRMHGGAKRAAAMGTYIPRRLAKRWQLPKGEGEPEAEPTS